ncbi:CheY-like receiver domain-containing protein [Opitutaceae bacterium TAV1]|nr:CheY-like receiver domain-containing protein [Opitutaceae bacterium TAV1]
MNTSAPLRILHADDSPVMRTLVRQILAGYSAQLDSVEDGREALDRLRVAGSCYALVITDQQMPRMTGLEMAEQARALPFTGEIAVFSTNVTEREREGFASLGVHSILKKNSTAVFSLPDIVKTVMERSAPAYPVPAHTSP